MAPSSSSRRVYAVGAVRKIEKRVSHDVIDGVDIYSFDNELQMEYFTNIEEPLPRKIRPFRGFEDRCVALDLLKNSFESFVRNYGKKVALPIFSDTSDKFLTSKKGGSGKDENSFGDGKASTGPVSVDETAANHTIESGVATTVPLNNDEPFQIADNQAEVITIDDSDSDDDVIMVGDPTAPLPKPVQNCCPNCGKFRRAKPSLNGGKPKTKSKGSDGDDDVVIVNDDELPDEVRSSSGAPVMTDVNMSAQPKHIVIVNDDEVPAQLDAPDKVAVSSEAPVMTDVNISAQPKHVVIVNDNEVLAQLDAPDKVTASSEAPVMTDVNISAQPKHVVVVNDDEVPAQLDAPDKVKASSEAPIMTNIDLSAQPRKATPPKESIAQEVDGLSLPNESLVLPVKPQMRKRFASSSEDEPPVKAQGVSSGTVQVPTKIRVNQKTVPHTVRLVLPDTKKTVILKLDGTKSKLLPPSAKRPLVRTIQVIVPQRELHDRVIVPQSHDQNGIKGQNGNEAPRIFPLMPNSVYAKPSFVALTTSSSSPAKVTEEESPYKIAIKSSEDGSMATDSFQVMLGAPANAGCSTETMSGKNPASFDTQSSKPLVVGNSTASVTQLNQTNSGGNLTSTDIQSSKPLVVGDSTKSVVRGLVDYVCRKEQFPESFPYDDVRTEKPYSLVPCKELRCRLGCVCISLAKKTVRRPRCKNASCIFGCECLSHGGFTKNRHSKTVRNEKKIMGVPRRRQALTVVPRCDTVSSETGCGTQTALKRFLPVQKASPFAKLMVQRLAPGLGPGHSAANSELSLHKSDVAPLSVSLTQRRFFGREKVPIPDRALMCMTPGLGYVPLVDITPKVTLRNPFLPGSTKSFLNVREATEWLNSELREILVSAPDLRWVVADKSTIEKKQLNRLSVDALKSPNCLISGPVLK